MNFIKFKIIIVLISFSMAGWAQRIITNSNGDKIVMYPDGSWRQILPGDSLLLRESLQKAETIGIQNNPSGQNIQRTQGEGEEFILRQWNELHFKIKEQLKKVQHDFRLATNAQFKAGEQLQNAEENKNLIEPDRLASLHEEYEKAIYNLHLAKLNQKALRKIADASKKMISYPPKKIEKKLPLLRAKFNSYLATYEPGHHADNSSPLVSNPTIENNGSTASNKNLPDVSGNISTRLPPQQIDKPYRSEPFHCIVTADTTDQSTGRRRIDLQDGLLFTHTDQDLRPYFKTKELITCYGHLTRMDAYIYFTIVFQIGSSHSQSNFGSLETGSLLRLRLLNGKYISLSNLKTDRGRIDPYSGNTIFTGQYALGNKEIDMLTSSPLDKIRILWSTGYEDYDVYKIDFLKNRLIACSQSRIIIQRNNSEMLGLKLPTDPRWVNLTEKTLEDILTDHAYCEQKAATSCISLIQSFPDKTEMVDALAPIVSEEWQHFRLVLAELKKRGLQLGKQRKDEYVNALIQFEKKDGSREDRLVERLLVCALIEARSCERFRLLSLHLSEDKLKEFYHGFMVSEAGHYRLFLDLANKYGDPVKVKTRWQSYLEAEAEIMKSLSLRGDRIH